MSSGAFDYNTVLKRVVFEMTNSGLRSVDYASGWSNRVPVAARRALMTGFNQVVAKVNEDNAAELETDMYEISWHSGYRPDHWWGGKWYTHDQLVSICGLGTVTGLCGANCYHDYSPVISGISEPTYTQEQLDKMNAKEQEKRLFYGKEYNMYEATQRQRKLETAMRAQRQKIKLLEDGGADEDDIIVARAKYRGMSQEYTAFSKAMDLPQQRERVTIDGLGNIGVGKWKKQLKNKPKSGIITPGRDSMGLSIEIDDFTPCLVEKSTGKIVDTKYSIANKSELKSLKQKGWNFNWTADDLKDSDIYKLTLENDDTIQGLVAVKDMPNDYAVYLKLAESAPHNIGKNKKYDGVGGHLFAIAAKLSMDSGYGGFIYFEAKNMDLVKHYRESFGGRLIGGAHQYRMIIDEDSAEILLKKYTLKGE